uniref:Uncharacterized protein n=1 Tax=Ornithorhynchus anatinus TaxID=9258 RepID=F7EY10_ORNAN
MDVNQSLREELTCAVCLAYFTDPVTIDCGHSFCRGCLVGSWGSSAAATPLSCPECRKPSEPRDLRPNLRLGKLAAIDKEKEEGRQPRRRGLCERHRQALKLFCREDEVPLCVACLGEGGHGDHPLSPLQEAAEDCKVRRRGTIRGDLEKAQVQHHNLTIQMEFEKMRGFLAEEEMRQILRLTLEEEEIKQRLEENERNVSQQSHSLRKMIGELEDKCEKPHLELLQKDNGDGRSEWNFKISLIFHPPHLMSTPVFPAVPMTLDENTAHPCLVLSDDRQSVSYSPQRRDLPDDPERFDRCPFVLGSQRFTSGRHFWEVKTEHSPECILGVCEETRSRKGNLELAPLHGFWTVALKNGFFCSSKTRFFLRSSPKIVGIYLDYHANVVSFYNMNNRTHLNTYKDIPFSGPLRPLFAPCIQMGEKSAGPVGIFPGMRAS